MSLIVTTDKEVTVVTIKSDNKNMFPPLCQVLGALCYSPVCCSVNKELINPCVTAVLGTVQIMIGLFSIVLGPGIHFFHAWNLTGFGAAYWLCAVYAAVGIMCILAGQFPSRCLVGLIMLVNIGGAAFALTGIVLYSIELGNVFLSNQNQDNQKLIIHADIMLMVLAVLHLFLCIGFITLGIRALFNRKKEKQDGKDVEDQQPELKENLMTSPCA